MFRRRRENGSRGSVASTDDWIDQKFVGPVLGLTEKERPVACIFLGYSEPATMAKRLPVDRHTTWYTEAEILT